MHPLNRFILGLFVVFMGLVFFNTKTHAQNVRTYVHPKAVPLVPVFKEELKAHFPHIPEPWYVLGLTEHESCPSLKHSRCFTTTAALQTKWKNGNRREEGRGLPQITRAWREDGTLRMDTLSSLKKAYPKELGSLSWENISESPALQIRAQILLLKDDYKALYVFKNDMVRLHATDSAYNGGRRDVLSARKVCGLAKGCDPDIWFDNIEKHCVKSKQAMYGGRSACDINTHHVRDVFEVRMPKYKSLLPKL